MKVEQENSDMKLEEDDGGPGSPTLILDQPSTREGQGVQESSSPKTPKKKKKDPRAVELPFESVARRIKAANAKPLDVTQFIPQRERDVCTDRAFLSKHIGGSVQRTYADISPAKPGYARFSGRITHVNTAFSPQAPYIPGESGIWLDPAEADLSSLAEDPDDFASTWGRRFEHLFCLIDTRKSLYMGQYRFIRSLALTTDEWANLPLSTRHNQIKMIETVVTWPARIRARIALRGTLGREPTVQELDGFVKRKKSPPTFEMIERAYDLGQESINVYVLECIGYDADLQHELIREYRKAQENPIPQTPSTDRKRNRVPPAKSTPNKKSRSAKAGGRKRAIKSEDLTDSDDEELDDATYRP